MENKFDIGGINEWEWTDEVKEAVEFVEKQRGDFEETDYSRRTEVYALGEYKNKWTAEKSVRIIFLCVFMPLLMFTIFRGAGTPVRVILIAMSAVLLFAGFSQIINELGRHIYIVTDSCFITFKSGIKNNKGIRWLAFTEHGSARINRKGIIVHSGIVGDSDDLKNGRKYGISIKCIDTEVAEEIVSACDKAITQLKSEDERWQTR